MECNGPWVESRVAVLYGGESEERAVSLKTGNAIFEALYALGYDVALIDATSHGLSELAKDPPDVAFVALHGGLGENGGVQGLLECLQVPYTGSGVHGCAVTMNKASAKAIWRFAGLVTPDWDVIARPTVREMLAGERVGAPAPCVVKPAYGGSSVGISLVRAQEEYYPALERALNCAGPVMVESFVSGRELTVALMDGDPMGIIEIRSARTFYDYDAKYGDSGTQYLCPAPVGTRVHNRVVDAASRAHALLECRGVSRVDFILDEDDVPWLLELNTMPGMTETSLVPKAAAGAGIDFPRFVQMMLNRATVDNDSLYV
jgi:D-alanine-D-alanine ligase